VLRVLSAEIMRTNLCRKAIARGAALLLLAQLSLLSAAAQESASQQPAPSSPSNPAPVTVLNGVRAFTVSGFAASDDTTYSQIVSDRIVNAAKEPAASYHPHFVDALRPHANRRAFVALSLGVYGMAALDQQQMLSDPTWRSDEIDPLVKPFVHLPTPVFVGGSIALETGVNLVAWRMGRSPRFHKIWWLPQLCMIGGNAYGYEETRAAFHY
jgi:hypothetical protein